MVREGKKGGRKGGMVGRKEGEVRKEIEGGKVGRRREERMR